MAQWVKDLTLLQLWWQSQLLLRFDPWPRNFRMPRVWPKRKKTLFIISLCKYAAKGTDLIKDI